MTASSKNLVVSTQPARPAWMVAGVVLGLLVGAGIAFLILVFAGAAAGNNNSMPVFNTAFKPVVLAAYALLATVAITLLILGRSIAALITAWLPVILLVYSQEIMKIVSLFA